MAGKKTDTKAQPEDSFSAGLARVLPEGAFFLWLMVLANRKVEGAHHLGAQAASYFETSPIGILNWLACSAS